MTQPVLDIAADAMAESYEKLGLQIIDKDIKLGTTLGSGGQTLQEANVENWTTSMTKPEYGRTPFANAGEPYYLSNRSLRYPTHTPQGQA